MDSINFDEGYFLQTAFLTCFEKNIVLLWKNYKYNLRLKIILLKWRQIMKKLFVLCIIVFLCGACQYTVDEEFQKEVPF